MNAAPTFSVAMVGGSGLVGSWYWTERSPEQEPINEHGPFLLKWLAVRDARRKLGANAVEVPA